MFVEELRRIHVKEKAILEWVKFFNGMPNTWNPNDPNIYRNVPQPNRPRPSKVETSTVPLDRREARQTLLYRKRKESVETELSSSLCK